LGNNNKQKGRIGELMVCLKLEQLGYQTTLVEAQGYDIIVNILNRPLRIQVKSAHSKDYNAKKGGKPRYNFATNVGRWQRKMSRKDTDLVALVGVNDDAVIFRPVEEIKTKTVKMSDAHFLDKAITQESFERCLSHVSVIG
jgi:hypothetical protein